MDDPVVNLGGASPEVIALVGVVIVVLGAVAYGVGYAILRAADRPQPTLLVMSLSMLTLLTVAAFVATSEQDLLTLTGVGLGALAGAVNAVFGGRSPERLSAEEPLVGPEQEPPRDSDEGS